MAEKMYSYSQKKCRPESPCINAPHRPASPKVLGHRGQGAEPLQRERCKSPCHRQIQKQCHMGSRHTCLAGHMGYTWPACHPPGILGKNLGIRNSKICPSVVWKALQHHTSKHEECQKKIRYFSKKTGRHPGKFWFLTFLGHQKKMNFSTFFPAGRSSRDGILFQFKDRPRPRAGQWPTVGKISTLQHGYYNVGNVRSVTVIR